MYSKTKTSPSTKDSSMQIERLKEALSGAEAVVIGAGAGLSTSAGFTYSGERFQKHFADFAGAYGFKDMYSGGFYPYKTDEERWAYWSRYIYVNRYMNAPKPVYQNLFRLIENKDYFVITTNVDHCFQKAGFDKERLFYTQGDFGLFQCSQPCCEETFDNEALVREMYLRQKDMRIPTELLPICPRCGRPLTTNLRADDKFAEDAGWHAAAERCARFLTEKDGAHVLYLELGVGFNTPAIIKYPFWNLTHRNPKSVYACVNMGEALRPREIAERSICINGDIGDVISALLA